MKNKNSRLLSVRRLSTHFFTDRGIARAVDHVSFDIRHGEVLALVGESGCGKSVTALSTLRLVPDPPGRIVDGEILFDGRDLLDFTEREMRAIRGKEIAMIFQEPMTSLNPVFRVGAQVAEAVILHGRVSRAQARERTIEMFQQVGIPAPEQRVRDYPHQLSGGMRQRVMIAMALSCNPRLLIADEATTALDVTIQAQILDLLRGLQHERNMSMLLITHDLGIVAGTADRVAVMYASRIVETAAVGPLYARPLHPYTIGLFGALPKLHGERGKLQTIPGTVPSPLDFPAGCKFHPRCTRATAQCSVDEPALEEIEPDHWAACWHPGPDIN
jgi:oligopeptide/dipeptide ABC transporter ATP-binding protein